MHAPRKITAHRILQPTALASMTSTIVVFLVRSTLASGLQRYVRHSSTVLWPHEIFAGLWSFHPGAFFHYILGDAADNVKQFWKAMPPRPGMTTRPNWRTHCIPLGLHGDGVPISAVRGPASKTVEALSWTSLLSNGATKFKVYLIWFVFSHLTKRNGFGTTWASFWRKIGG